MKKFFIFALFATSITRCSFSKPFQVDPRVYPVLIAQDNGSGSGCLLQLSNSVYLATAKHVLFAPSEGTNPPALRSSQVVLRAYSERGSNVSACVLFVNLLQLNNAGEIRCSTNRDVALVRIEDCDAKDHNIVSPLPGVTWPKDYQPLTILPAYMVSPLRNIDVGTDVYMFGYPTSLTGPIRDIFDPWEPLLRKGIVAGVNLERRTIIIDCPSYQGNSGGPVVRVDRETQGELRFRLIGLVSGFVPFQEEWENKTLHYSHVLASNSGYTIIEPLEIAVEMAWK